ncbi:MAG TPA: gamma-glutamyl-gamma-aminobutyrate hydrolase family protein [Dehalococcoidia bacterium]|nr:gamma-glutamyl-gamma-aminobutyrate hydrolase family protein [Dehalococcoidia bacterium]
MRRVGVTRWEDVAGESIERYWQRLRDAGLEPVDMHGPGCTLEGLSGLVLTGGVDIDPARYGAERHERVRRIDPLRDEFESALLHAALRQDMPVLAICRGHQLLNVCLGGSLLQHIESGEHVADYRSEGFPSRSHEVVTAAGSRLREWLGERCLVNSRHHQAVTTERLAPGLTAAATSADGLVEGIESQRHTWVVGVQWHPERDEPQLAGFEASGRRLFEELAAVVLASAVRT